MANRSSSSRPKTSMEDEETRKYNWEERRVILSDAFDASIRCMNLAYTHPEESMQRLLATEALVWSNFVVANAIMGLGQLNR